MIDAQDYRPSLSENEEGRLVQMLDNHFMYSDVSIELRTEGLLIRGRNDEGRIVALMVPKNGTTQARGNRYAWAQVKVSHPPEATTDHTVPGEKWEFDQAVTDVFEDMLARSIPAYATMRDACNRLAAPIVGKSGSFTLDIGCSRGGAIADLLNFAGDGALFLGLEISEPMLGAATARFESDARVSIQKHDLVRDIDKDFLDPPSLILSVLTIMFTPIEHRLRLLRKLYDALLPGGTLLFVEKLIGGSASIDGTMTEAYLQLKRDQGYSEEEIQRKKLSLEGVLVPMTAGWNEEMLNLSGFRDVDCFWRYLNFGGWIARKDSP